ncbi:c96a3797-1557-4f6b-9abf-6f69871b1ac1 [Sclerotinia trifoliorum]|uniref:C96a3797-1557-4f6b-9abf-6f69871b1ac1 n=1 Tax=Sclerotinia trifoliorum TaxID=28548 RepID=A0A8H2VZN6_9HELO|nr:c96a3797-1557-4f6b-9abf-6f69871b1ac1 [Sclerotinia trifoliorum]
MSCRQSSQCQRLSTSHELYAPWWSPLAQWRRRNEGWLRQRLRSRRNHCRRTSISVEEEKLDGRREPNVFEGQRENEDNTLDNAALHLTRSSRKDYGSDFCDDNTANSNTVPSWDTTFISDNTSKSNNGSNSDTSNFMQHHSNQTKQSSEQAATKIRGGGSGTSRNISDSGAYHNSYPSHSTSTLESGVPCKSWVSRFKNDQKSNKARRRRNRTQRSSSINGLRFALHKREYSNLGIELSYADMTRGEWKLQSRVVGNENLRKPRPGSSNLRYCLSYSKQALDTVSGVRMPWDQYRQWFSLRRTARAAASCMGL